jgi:hypothetical protein
MYCKHLVYTVHTSMPSYSNQFFSMVNVFFCLHYCLHEILTFSELYCTVCMMPALFHALKGLDHEMNVLSVHALLHFNIFLIPCF